jgi:hypothetical protein
MAACKHAGLFVHVITTPPTAGAKETRANMAVIEERQPIKSDGLLAIPG